MYHRYLHILVLHKFFSEVLSSCLSFLVKARLKACPVVYKCLYFCEVSVFLIHALSLVLTV